MRKKKNVELIPQVFSSVKAANAKYKEIFHKGRELINYPSKSVEGEGEDKTERQQQLM